MMKIAKTRGTKNSYSVLFIKLSVLDKTPHELFTHSPHQNFSSVCELSLYIPQNCCFPFWSFFNRISFTVTISPRCILLKIQYGTICK